MLNLARALAGFGVLAAAALAAATSLINDEAMGTYRRALDESSKNRPKATALLRGLLLSNVTVGVDETTLSSSDYEWKDGIQAGLDIWDTAIDDSPFQLAERGEKPDVLIKFVREIEDGRHAQGMVKAQRHFYWKGTQAGGRVEGVIYVRTSVGRRWITGDEVSRVIVHELGHLLGLDDDRKSDGAMGDFVAGRGLKQPSREEVQSVRDFRRMIRDALAKS